MATSKTSSFWLTETVQSTVATAGIFTGTIDLGAYVDVGDQQALAIEEVDVVFQRYDSTNDVYDGNLPAIFTADAAIDVQVSDLNPNSAILRADSHALIAGGTILIDDTNGMVSVGPDMYPDNFGKLDQSRMVVNDSLYLVIDVSTAPAANLAVAATVRIKGRIVKLSSKDWMAIAIQSTAADN